MKIDNNYLIRLLNSITMCVGYFGCKLWFAVVAQRNSYVLRQQAEAYHSDDKCSYKTMKISMYGSFPEISYAWNCSIQFMKTFLFSSHNSTKLRKCECKLGFCLLYWTQTLLVYIKSSTNKIYIYVSYLIYCIWKRKQYIG